MKDDEEIIPPARQDKPKSQVPTPKNPPLPYPYNPTGRVPNYSPRSLGESLSLGAFLGCIGMVVLALVIAASIFGAMNSGGGKSTNKSGVGTCWEPSTDQQGYLRETSCNSNSMYLLVATREVSSPSNCTDVYINWSAGKYLCLMPK